MFDRLIDLLSDWVKWFRFWVVVQQFECSAKTTFGKNPKELGPGFHFVWPFGIDTVFADNRVPSVKKLEPQTITIRDGKTIVVRVVMTIHVDDPILYFFGVEHSEAAIMDAGLGVATEVLQPLTWEEILFDPPVKKLTTEIRKNARKWGIGVDKVGLSDIAIGKAHRLYIGTEENPFRGYNE